jgi:glycosyltransferase involved in cell wall biosynthesis
MKKKKLKIAIFHLAFFYSGGGERLVLEEIKGLKLKGHKVTCYSPVVEDNLCFPDKIRSFGIKTILPKFPRLIAHQETLEILLTCVLFPFFAYKFKNYDIILAANQPSAWFAFWIKIFFKVPYVTYLAQATRILYPRKIDKSTGIWMKQKSLVLPFLVKIFKPIFWWADIISIRNSDKVLVNGDYVAGIIKKVYGVNVVSCPAGANILNKSEKSHFEGEVKINDLVINKPYILVTNRHFPQKKFEYAVNAIEEIVRTKHDVRLVITGNETEYTKYLKELVNKRSLGKNIFFTGYVPENKLKELYKNASVYVYTSAEEDFGMGVIEAMAAGVPVIAWDRGGPTTTIIDGKTGYLIKSYDQKKFTAKIIRLLVDKKLNVSMSMKARIHVSKNFTIINHMDILEKTLTSVTK